MANKNVGIALILSAYDRASMVVNNMTNNAIARMNTMQKRTSEMADKSFRAGQQMVTAGVAMTAPVLGVVKAYADQESAMLGLQSVMLNSSGRVGREFEKLNALAIQLGNKLPGDTAEFYQLFETMIRNGGRAQDILAGTGKAAAYLAVQLKIPTMAAGETMQRMQVATGTANKDMMAFADTLARVNQLGPSVQEMEMAFFRSAGALKTMKIQGLAATKEVANVFAMLIRSGSSGEIAGSGFKAMITNMGNAANMAKFNAVQKGMGLNMQFMNNKTGDFLGVENMMKQFDMMKNLSTRQKGILIQALVGTGGDAETVAKLVNEGMVGYKKMMEAQERQATLEQKVELQLKSLKNMWDAVKGTMINVAAEIGKTLAPQFKALMDRVNNFLPKVMAFIQNHKTLVTWALKGAIVLGGLSLAVGYLSFTFSGIIRIVSTTVSIFNWGIKAFKFMQFAAFALRYSFVMKVIPAIKMIGTTLVWLGRMMMTTPLGLWMAAIAVVALLVYKYWEPIKRFFSGLWDFIKAIFQFAWAWIKKLFLNYTPAGLIFKHWDKVKGYFVKLWNGVKAPFIAIFKWIMGFSAKFLQAGINIVKNIINGIMSMVGKVGDVMHGLAKKIRSYLPFSPAKAGPLMDIHRVKLVETIAMSIKPNALIQAWNKTLSSFHGAVNTGKALPVRGGKGGNAFSSQMVFAPVIHLNGGATKADAKLITTELEKQFEKLMGDWQNRQQTIRYR